METFLTLVITSPLFSSFSSCSATCHLLDYPDSLPGLSFLPQGVQHRLWWADFPGTNADSTVAPGVNSFSRPYLQNAFHMNYTALCKIIWTQPLSICIRSIPEVEKCWRAQIWFSEINLNISLKEPAIFSGLRQIPKFSPRNALMRTLTAWTHSGKGRRVLLTSDHRDFCLPTNPLGL